MLTHGRVHFQILVHVTSRALYIPITVLACDYVIVAGTPWSSNFVAIISELSDPSSDSFSKKRQAKKSSDLF